MPNSKDNSIIPVEDLLQKSPQKAYQYFETKRRLSRRWSFSAVSTSHGHEVDKTLVKHFSIDKVENPKISRKYSAHDSPSFQKQHISTDKAQYKAPLNPKGVEIQYSNLKDLFILCEQNRSSPDISMMKTRWSNAKRPLPSFKSRNLLTDRMGKNWECQPTWHRILRREYARNGDLSTWTMERNVFLQAIRRRRLLERLEKKRNSF